MGNYWIKIGFVLCSFLSFQSVQSQIIRVPDDQPTIRQAVQSASHGDTVLVAPGIYYENIFFNGKRILLASWFATTGNPDFIASTIIHGGNPVHADTASCVLFIHGEDSTSQLVGFTLTGGKGTRWEDEHGRGNWYTEGGAILIQAASPVIRNNILVGNEAIRKNVRTVSAGGGAIRSGDGNPKILNNLIIQNKGLYGGGIVLNYSGALIANNIIADNSGGQDFGGGGIWINGNNPKPRLIINNTIVGNRSTTNGGGINQYSGTADLVNNIIYHNSAPVRSQISGSPRVTYSDVQGGFAGTGNFDDPPRLAGALYELPEDSHCIDAGDPSPQYNDREKTDQAGQAASPSKGTVRNDMGCYGGPGAGLFVLPNLTSTFPERLEKGWMVYPNPATTELYVRHNGSPANQIKVTLLGVGGNIHLETFPEPTTGELRIPLPASLKGDGLYFIELTIDGRSAGFRPFIKSGSKNK